MQEIEEVFEQTDEQGTIIIRKIKLFDGIWMIYTEAHRENYSFTDSSAFIENVFEISHCQQGRLECGVKDSFCYMSPGDLIIAKTKDVKRDTYFPLHHFHGLCIRIDISQTPDNLSNLLDGVSVNPKDLMEKFCNGRDFFIARSHPSVENIFAEMYNVPKDIQVGYMKVKVLELLLFLTAYRIEENEVEDRSLSVAQVKLAKEVAQYLLSQIDQKVTLEELARKFHMSESYIKNSFKSVYGVSYYNFVKAQKMESAAYLLEYTDQSIVEIAGKHGYDNSSKFASAFRSIFGMTPTQYRKEKQMK